MSTSIRTDSLSTTGAWIGAAAANSTQENPPAVAPASAAEAFRKSRRFIEMRVMISLPTVAAGLLGLDCPNCSRTDVAVSLFGPGERSSLIDISSMNLNCK
jgi:hypothetical protein